MCRIVKKATSEIIERIEKEKERKRIAREVREYYRKRRQEAKAQKRIRAIERAPRLTYRPFEVLQEVSS